MIKDKLKHLLYKVDKLPLVSSNGNPTPNYGLFNKGVHLSTVSNRYTVLQNEEVIDLIEKSIIGIEHDIIYDKVKAKSFNQGRQISIQLPLPDYQIQANDSIKRYITVINSFDRTTSVGFGVTNTVVSCQNTIAGVLKSISTFKHTASVHDKLHYMAKNINKALAAEYKIMLVMEIMKNTNIPSTEEIDELIFDYLDIDYRYKSSTKVEGKALSSRKDSNLVALTYAIRTETNNKGSNMWGLFNGFTRYSNHHLKVNPYEYTKDFEILSDLGSIALRLNNKPMNFNTYIYG